jgi:archaeosine synthase
MSTFQVIMEKGLARTLRCQDKPSTPWLLSTSNGLKLGDEPLHQYILAQNGFISLDLEDLQENPEFMYHSTIPEWSFIAPRLNPATTRLSDSLQYELDLFLDRLDQAKLPEIVGFSYNPIQYPPEFLDELLVRKPSIIALQLPALEDMPPRKLIQVIMEIRNKIPVNVALYLPGGVPVGFQTVLIALGIDILDDSSAYRSAGRRRSFQDGFILRVKEDNGLRDRITRNLKELQRDFDGVKGSLTQNILWSRIARDMHAHPNVASLVKLLGKENHENLKLKRFPRNANNKLTFTGDEGLYHPEVLAFQDRVIQRYRVPNHTKLVVILPCSARKPYLNSKSHKFFEKAINKGSHRYRLSTNVWSLTSPLGVVPRELERFYPAQHYDIPVTGDWSDEETHLVGKMLLQMLEQLPVDCKVIVHVSEGYRGVIEFVQKDFEIITSWIGSKPTADEALFSLTNTISQALMNSEGESLREKKYEYYSKRSIHAAVRYNHGLKSNVDLDEISFVGRPPRPIQVQKKNIHWLTWDSLSGNVRLSPEAALQVASSSENWIRVDTDSLKGSTLYGIAIIDASHEISPGDEVLVFNTDKSRLLGVGTALISGSTMTQVKSGPTVKLRKKCSIEVVP